MFRERDSPIYVATNMPTRVNHLQKGKCHRHTAGSYRENAARTSVRYADAEAPADPGAPAAAAPADDPPDGAEACADAPPGAEAPADAEAPEKEAASARPSAATAAADEETTSRSSTTSTPDFRRRTLYD
jgi:hypothetical protein